jgi:hypothetical protein
MAPVLVVADRVLLNLVVLGADDDQVLVSCASKNTADQHNSPTIRPIAALSRSAVRSVDRPIDAVATCCYA